MEEPSRTLSERHVKWLEARGLDPELAVKLGLYTQPQKFGGSDGDALVFPYVREERVINRKYRGKDKRFAQDEGAPRSLWNEDALRDPTLADMPALISEGELDALAALQGDHPRSMSVPDGAGSNLDFFEGIWGLLQPVKRFILAGDNDEPGRKLNAELARRFGAARCSWLEYPAGFKDLGDVLREHGEAGVRNCIARARPYPIKGLYKLSDYPKPPELRTFSTGWPNLDPHLRLWPAEFMVITGIPTHGKSTWALNLAAMNAELHGQNWAIASFEMRVRPYVADVLKRFHGASDEDEEAWIDERFVFIDQDPSDDERIDVDWLIDKASDAVVRYGVRHLLVDPWNQVQHARRKGESTVEYQERAIADLKRFGRAFDCGVYVVTHPTKEVKDPRTGKMRTPGLYDIDGSAHWYNAADHGVVIDRPDIGSNLVRVLVRKSRYRQGGVPGEASLRYDFRTWRYVPVDEKESGDGRAA